MRCKPSWQTEGGRGQSLVTFATVHGRICEPPVPAVVMTPPVARTPPVLVPPFAVPPPAVPPLWMSPSAVFDLLAHRIASDADSIAPNTKSGVGLTALECVLRRRRTLIVRLAPLGCRSPMLHSPPHENRV